MRLRCGAVADDAVNVEGSVAVVLVGVFVIQLWRVAAFLGLSYVAFTALTAVGPDNEVAETECRAVPAGDGERVLAAHEQAIVRQHRRRVVGIVSSSLSPSESLPSRDFRRLSLLSGPRCVARLRYPD